MITEEIKREVQSIISTLRSSNLDFGSNMICGGFVPPFTNQGDLKLIIVGQDPTVKNEASRKKITCTLDLDKDRSMLRQYVERICKGLSIELSNVYATNLFKYFYEIPPSNTPDVLKKHLKPNLELLKEELEELPLDCPIITLGQPVLHLLLSEKVKLRDYWGYSTGIEDKFAYISAGNNIFKRKVFPFCHQASLRKAFYNKTFDKYLSYVKMEMGR